MLPILMRKLGSLGLIYRRCNTKETERGVKLVLECEGTLDCEKSFLVKSIKEVPNVESIISIIQSNEQSANSYEKQTDNSKPHTQLHPLRLNDAITQDVLNLVEDRLSEAYGPAANLLLKSAAKQSTCVGDLFAILAKDLSEDQKILFLRDVEGYGY